MIAASRFEGGSWVRAGFLVTYTAFAYGCVVVGLAAVRGRELRPRFTVAGVFALATVAALALPAVEFPGETFNGFRGLDLLSVLTAVALAAVVVAGGSMRVPAALCLAGVLGGNLLIQHFTTRGSTDRFGLATATAAAFGSLLSAAAGVRGGRGTHR